MEDLGDTLGRLFGQVAGVQSICFGAIVSDLVARGIMSRDEAVQLYRSTADLARVEAAGGIGVSFALALEHLADALERGDQRPSPFTVIQGGVVD